MKKVNSPPYNNLKREINLPALIALGLGGMIGSGIFMLPASMAAIAGPGLLVAIALGGVMAFFLALFYAELGAAFPLTGGPFSLPRLALGNLGGFLIGWGYFLYLFVGTAAIINIFVVYLGFYFPGLVKEGVLTPMGIIIALGFNWALTIVNIFGVKWGSLYATITTISKLIPLLLFFAFGITLFKTSTLTPFMPFGWIGVTLATTLFFWSYTGFESIVVPIEEVKNPAKTIPWAMGLTVIIAMVVYLLVGIAFLGMVNALPSLHLGNWAELGHLEAPLAQVASGSNSRLLPIVMAIGALIATGGAAGSWILIQGRMPFAMAKERLFWSKMAVINQFGTPARSLVFASILTSLVIILIPRFIAISLVASITALVPYAAAVLSVPILRKTCKEVKRPFVLKSPNFLGSIGFVFATWLIYWAAWPWTLVGMCLFFIGFPLFYFFCKEEFEWKRNSWLVVYLLGITIASFFGDPRLLDSRFVFYPSFPILKMPYDLLFLACFAVGIYFWAYRSNICRPCFRKEKE